MIAASLELCEKLYKMTGWETDENLDWYHGIAEPFRGQGTGYIRLCPAYGLGYLLRKLPHISVTHYKRDWEAHVYVNSVGPCEASTPEDAVCKLAIKMIKAGMIS